MLSIGKSRERLTRAALHVTVKKVFDGAADWLRQRGDDYAARADLLEHASAHWLRHTAGSHMANQQIDLRLVRDNLGHESLSTTSQYLHADDDRRHKETEQKHRIGWYTGGAKIAKAFNKETPLLVVSGMPQPEMHRP